ncbi:MAG: hypothetical protein WDM81_14920 [Rhizomicrobium sp.]
MSQITTAPLRSCGAISRMIAAADFGQPSTRRKSTGPPQSLSVSNASPARKSMKSASPASVKILLRDADFFRLELRADHDAAAIGAHGTGEIKRRYAERRPEFHDPLRAQTSAEEIDQPSLLGSEGNELVAIVTGIGRPRAAATDEQALQGLAAR